MATLKAQWIAGLKDELKQARAHLKRWRDLGKRFGKTHTEGWKATEALRKSIVKSLKLQVDHAESKPIKAKQ
jgi:DNA/RNA-binding domain of Phe-tRNA-synthetase-like protein